LRRPVVIVSEVAAIGLACALVAALPQQPDEASVGVFAMKQPGLAQVTSALGLHDVVTSAWFLALVFCAFCSLVAVQIDQWRRARKAWSEQLTPVAFARASYRKEFSLEALTQAPPAARLERGGRLALLGSPIFHLGLATVAVAGLLRLLYFQDGAVRVFEGMTLEASPNAWDARRSGWLAPPLALEKAVRVDQVRFTRYDSGELRQVTARLVVEGAPAGEAGEASVNAPLELPGVRLYVSSAHGLAALVELLGPGGAHPQTLFFESIDDVARARLRTPEGREVRLRAAAVEARPDSLDVRVIKDDVLLSVATLRPGGVLPLGADESLRLVALPLWVDLRANHDPSRPLFFAGIATGILGVILLFGVVRVDTGVFIEGGKLVVALRAQRFTPLYAERFERLCQRYER
jgi:hypothetical protein